MHKKKYFLRFLILALVFSSFGLFARKKRGPEFTIMLDPAGDAQKTGRQIGDTLERAITLQFAQKLKTQIESKFKNIKVIITRSSGEAISPLQNASFANRLDVDFYLNINFYKYSGVKSHAYIYTFSHKDDFFAKQPEFKFCPYDQAHLENKEVTRQCADIVKNIFVSGDNPKYFDFSGVFGIPISALIGIKAPAIAIEIGLNNKESFDNYIDIFVKAIEKIGEFLD